MYLQVASEHPKSHTKSTPVLFVHGMWHGAWCWKEHFLPYFAQHGYASYALNLRGHDGSEGEDRLRWTSLDDYVVDVEQVAHQMHTSPIMIGHSMGGMIVQKYLERNQAPAAILLASTSPHGVLPTTLRLARRHPLAFTKVGLTFSMYPLVSTPQLAQDAFFSADMPEERLTSYSARLQDESYRVILDMIVLDLPHPEKVKTSLLVLGGTDDQLVSPDEVRATARAYGTEAELFSNMAHDMMLEADWQAVADRILNWLDELAL
jgi:pimeloyl-ACP methyl ester carboxylesterase